MGGLSFEKLLIIAAIAVFIIGPTRLPAYAAKLGQWVRTARGYLDSAQERVKDEMGDDFPDIDWKKLDPRQYDPRRIIRDALLDDSPLPAATGSVVSAPSGAAAGAASGNTVIGAAGVAASRTLVPRHTPGEAPPFDAEAT
ncbi:twin-arginine translocase TatA/TatE family subunit [Gryllotalpicola sp.]|uniref:twin-arginine translocase TatA/TatE family subunit n=1 Tax=Gryllotalpicola sp. TaxID=1932787 RepID=UPI0026397F98|nr:twin-arginine translocase TatA/TatE family subunit [Gryllotalpicola sp.]